MKAYKNEITQKIYDLLAPMIGDLMAQGTIKSRANALGISEESISYSDLPRMAEEIRKGLVIFYGSDAAEKIAARITRL